MAAGILIYTAAASLIGGLGFGLKAAAGVAAGGALIFFNLLWLSSLVRELLVGKTSSLWFGIKVAGKTLLLFGAVGALIGFKLVDPLAFLVGLTSLVVSVMAVGIRSRSNRKAPEGKNGE